MMHAQALDKFVKKPVKDTYGRDLGHVIGFSLDSAGNMKGLGVDHGTGSFQEYSHERIIIDGKSETIILLPEWREDVDKLKKNTLTAYQCSPRGGYLKCQLLKDRVLIGGSSARYMEGKITL